MDGAFRRLVRFAGGSTILCRREFDQSRAEMGGSGLSDDGIGGNGGRRLCHDRMTDWLAAQERVKG